MSDQITFAASGRMHAVYIVAAPPWGHGRSGGARTPNPRFWRPVLYQLSYTPIHSAGSIALRPSRRPLRGLLRMTFFFNAIINLRHPEGPAQRASRRTHDLAAAYFSIL